MLDSRTNRVFREGGDVMIVNVTAAGLVVLWYVIEYAHAVRVRFCLATERVGRMQRKRRESEKGLCVVHRPGEPHRRVAQLPTQRFLAHGHNSVHALGSPPPVVTTCIYLSL